MNSVNVFIAEKISINSMKRENLNLIPKPIKITPYTGFFNLNSNTEIVIYPILKENAKFFCKLLKTDYQIREYKQDLTKTNSIQMILDESLYKLGKEGYFLRINPESIDLRASHPAGIFYGIQTLIQLIMNSNQSIPCLEIEDYPRFKWRGVMLDEGRYFFGINYVKHILDTMAFFKMNIFHWHLTEDLGWRIEIKRYPKLTEIGSKRKDTQIGGWFSKKRAGKPHEGYYTQEQVREIIQYAEERFIKIIPEIDIPGHSMAALAAYPEYSCTGGPFTVPETVGIKKDVYCPGKEITFTFLQNILEEVIQLFKGNYIHIGGDEVPKDRWKLCSDCKNRMQREKIKDVQELQVYFTNRIVEFLKSKAIKAIGWNEIMGPHLNQDVIIEWWKWGKKKIINDLEKGRKFIICKSRWQYFDFDHSLTPIKKVYNYDPIPHKYINNILGIEAALWTEWVPNEDIADWLIFPRLLATAENAWLPYNLRNYKDFHHRLEVFVPWMEENCRNYMKKKLWNPSLLVRLIDLPYLAKGNTYAKYNK